MDPELTFTQLECLRVVLSQRGLRADHSDDRGGTDVASPPLVELYKRLFSEPDLGHLRALQRAVFEYDKLGTEPKRLGGAVDCCASSPLRANGTTRTSGALDALLVRDITFKQIAPFQVTGDAW